ncbi:MAG: hypothetical protein KF716_24630 [Anaerolineae bacterium]|nr:hypothetical protein [Anaerolineae bacterium]
MKLRTRLTWALVAWAAVMALMMPLQYLVTAQDATFPTLTPPPSPTGNGGTATWTVDSQTFISNYPMGMEFTLKASSSAGEIKNATAIWKLSPVSLQRAAGVFNKETGQWEFLWDSLKSPMPAWVGLQYWFVLEDEKGNDFTTNSWQAEYADNTRSWGRAESEDIIVYWEHPIDDEFGKLTLDAMAEQRETYRIAWGSLLSYKPRAIYYATRDSYFEWDRTRNSIGRRDVGQTSSSWGGTVQYNYNGNLREGAYGTVLHEVAHLYQSDKRSTTGIQWWTEGQATFFEREQMYDYVGNLKAIAKQQGLGPLRSDWGVYFGGRTPYDTGYAFIKYLTDTYGLDILDKITQNMRAGKPLLDAIPAAVGKSLDEIEYDYRVWLGLDDPTVPTQMPTLGFSFPPTPTFPPTKTPKP